MAAASSEEGSPPALVEKAKKLIRHFLELTDPSLLPINGAEAFDIPISQWEILYTTQKAAADLSTTITPFITVRSHPSPGKNLFSVQSILPDIDARQFWSLMANSDNRSLWDSTTELSSVQYWLADEILKDDSLTKNERSEYESLARRLSARVELLRFGSIMFVANKRDMVLLSVDTQLPSKDGCLRLMSTSSSIEVSSLPPKKGYNRFHLNIGGFLVEGLRPSNTDSALKGIRVTQVSDLGEMANWVPASIIKMVASTMVPKSMNVISKVAFKMKVPKALTLKGYGYSGEQELEEVERHLCESGGGTWPAKRHLAPLLSARDLLLQPDETNAENVEAAPEVLMLAHPQSDTEADAIHLWKGIATETMETEMLAEEERLPVSGQAEVPRSADILSMTQTVSQAASLIIEADVLEATQSLAMQDSGCICDDDIAQEATSLNKDDDIGNDSLASLFSAEDSKDCTHLLSRHTNTIKRMSVAQRETQRRISLLLVSGSDSLAMAIAPGARSSMKEVAHIMNLSIGSSEAEKLIQSTSNARSSRPRLASSTSNPAPPSTSMMNIERHSDSIDTADSSTSSATLCEEENASPVAWTGNLTEAAYIMATGIINLASWIATRPQTSSASLEDAVKTLSREVETSRPTLSALGVTRQAYLQRDALRLIRPQSQYRVDDVKLHPFPLINDENLPPLGIATGQPTTIMHCDQAKEASLHQEPLLRQGWWASFI